ncbi:hypothetical protein QFC19_006558 [Naganishia cerealis]|jgi:predicted CoA-binding protein|uniref:Uncharacterized protein n=1 Tax=Naganishia cerealis TaxID=610337 RepID=A0ACC2VHB3_9TREE|nr:hypothetical protein QFC19_006558 [Naganishia cerealis]
MSMKPRIKNFFGAARQYVVSGASNNPSKFGFKITLWYVAHDLPVIPVNPKEKEILGKEVIPSAEEVLKLVIEAKDVGEHKLSQVDGVSISFLTPPSVTASTLKQLSTVEGYKNAIKGLWFQPGSYDREVIAVSEQIGLFDRVVYEDECILVRGEEGLYSANL